MKCNVCPRQCNVDKRKHIGFCAQKNIKISKVMFHKYEEPLISGCCDGVGSGAIFFAGCNLRCAFCQNYSISHGGKGRKVSTKGLVRIIKKLEKKGALNINFVTPSHFTNEIIETLKIYKPSIPVVWNSNGYESQESIKRLKDFVDAYLVDLKYMDNTLALKYSKAGNYVENATKSIMQMRENQSNDIVEDGLMKKGVIIRHLILPTHTQDSIRCLDWINTNLGSSTIVSLMSQYNPMYDAEKHPEINRKITPLEYKRVINHAIKLNMMNCFTQDLSSATDIYTPKF